MSRALDVLLGATLIATVWAWMIISLKAADTTWLTVVMSLCKVWAACLITAPVYREYLR